jgi:NADPH:quinone reductase-like Zn-dependent oxidoreductase
VIAGVAGGAGSALPYLEGLLETGELRTVIDRRYSLDEIAEAHRYVEAGHKRGHVLILLPTGDTWG